MRSLRIAVAVSVAGSLLLASCGESPRAEAELSPRTGRPVKVDPKELLANPAGTTRVASAGLSEDLAVVRLEYDKPGIRHATAAAVRSPKGDWDPLPVPEVSGDFDLAAAGDTVVLGGLECISDGCDQFKPRFLILDSDRKKWVEIDSDLAPIAAEPDSEQSAVFAYRRAMRHAVFTFGVRDYAVDSAGHVEEMTYPEPKSAEETGFYCLTDDTEILVHGVAMSVEDPVQLTGDVEIRKLDRLLDGFVPVAVAPKLTVDNLSSVCGHRVVTLHSGATGYTFSLDDQSWVTAESNFKEVNNGSTIAAAGDAQIASSDGTVFAENLTRSPEGTWSVLPSGLNLVPTSGKVVYAITDDGVETFKR